MGPAAPHTRAPHSQPKRPRHRARPAQQAQRHACSSSPPSPEDTRRGAILSPPPGESNRDPDIGGIARVAAYSDYARPGDRSRARGDARHARRRRGKQAVAHAHPQSSARRAGQRLPPAHDRPCHRDRSRRPVDNRPHLGSRDIHRRPRRRRSLLKRGRARRRTPRRPGLPTYPARARMRARCQPISSPATVVRRDRTSTHLAERELGLEEVAPLDGACEASRMWRPCAVIAEGRRFCRGQLGPTIRPERCRIAGLWVEFDSRRCGR